VWQEPIFHSNQKWGRKGDVLWGFDIILLGSQWRIIVIFLCGVPFRSEQVLDFVCAQDFFLVEIHHVTDSPFSFVCAFSSILAPSCTVCLLFSPTQSLSPRFWASILHLDLFLRISLPPFKATRGWALSGVCRRVGRLDLFSCSRFVRALAAGSPVVSVEQDAGPLTKINFFVRSNRPWFFRLGTNKRTLFSSALIFSSRPGARRQCYGYRLCLLHFSGGAPLILSFHGIASAWFPCHRSKELSCAPCRLWRGWLLSFDCLIRFWCEFG
jgi:hypothetical protein